MNIFALDSSPIISAQMMCDKHVVKMVIETAQLLSTAHRMIDGIMYVDKTANGRSIKRWRLSDNRENLLYKASHINHPSNIWARQTNNNYNWLYCHFVGLCKEYTYRYGKIHLTEAKLSNMLRSPPNYIEVGPLTRKPQAMPDQYKREKSEDAYKAYYIGEKHGFAKWTRRPAPFWWANATKELEGVS